MLFKVFTKQRKGGEYVREDLEFNEQFYEISKLLGGFQSRNGKKVYKWYGISILNSNVAFEGEVDLQTQGYEIISHNGKLLERFVTA